MYLSFYIGYPLITLVGHAVSRIFSFVGNPALVLNLLGVLFAGIGVYFLCGTIYYLTNGDWVSSMFASRTFYLLSSHVVLISFGSTLWTQSVQFEVFTMNNMFVSMVLFLTAQFFYFYWRGEKDKRRKCTQCI